MRRKKKLDFFSKYVGGVKFVRNHFVALQSELLLLLIIFLYIIGFLWKNTAYTYGTLGQLSTDVTGIFHYKSDTLPDLMFIF